MFNYSKFILSVFSLNRALIRSKGSVCELPKVHRLKNEATFQKLLTPEIKLLNEIFTKYNYQLKIAGGAVRDLLLDIFPHDVDLATNAVPQQMLDMFQKENIRVLNLNGIRHGTVPVRINDKFFSKANYEITTLRIDVKTYGRHAEVEFTNDWHKDAIRRDLTINALFLDFDGKVYDYVNGVEDIENKVVRFVGVPEKRVKEDYLRILRYFRFYSRICGDCERHDAESINAIKKNVDGLEKISGERIGSELRKILAQKFVDSFMRMFYEFKMDKYLGLPENGDVEKFCQIYKLINKNTSQPFTILASLMKSPDDINRFHNRIKLSNQELLTFYAILKYEEKFRTEKDDENLLCFIMQEMLRPRALLNSSLNKQTAIEVFKYIDRIDMIEKVNSVKLPMFPLRYEDLMNHSIENNTGLITLEMYSKQICVIRFKAMFNDIWLRWIDSKFKLTKDQILDSIDQVYLKNFLKEKKDKKKL